LEASKGHDVKRVTVVNVEIGEFTFLVPEQLEFNFEIASQDTILEGAKLNIKMVKGRIRCKECGNEGEAGSLDEALGPAAMFAPMKCTKCGSSATMITGGKDFLVSNIEAEVATAVQR
jgi:hydrogenase nickel incorporation protein HypA/HybF